MITQSQQELIQAAEELYATQLRLHLEPDHNGEFVAIEPISGDFFLGKTLSDAIQEARRTHPTRLPYTMGVGIQPAIHLGQEPPLQSSRTVNTVNSFVAQ